MATTCLGDPVFAAIKDHQAALDVFNAYKGPDEGPEAQAIYDRECEACERLYDTTPTTTAGIIAFLRHAYESKGCDASAPFDRVILNTIAALTAHLSVG